MIGISLLSIALATTPMAKPREIELSAQDRRAFLIGVERRVGGKFIVSGISDAEGSCAQLKACENTGTVLRKLRVDPHLGAASDVSELIARTRIDGQVPVALVSARAARWHPGSGNLTISLSVFDKASGQWKATEAVLSSTSNGILTTSPDPSVPGATSEPRFRTLLSWRSDQ